MTTCTSNVFLVTLDTRPTVCLCLCVCVLPFGWLGASVYECFKHTNPNPYCPAPTDKDADYLYLPVATTYYPFGREPYLSLLSSLQAPCLRVRRHDPLLLVCTVKCTQCSLHLLVVMETDDDNTSIHGRIQSTLLLTKSQSLVSERVWEQLFCCPPFRTCSRIPECRVQNPSSWRCESYSYT